MPPANNNIANAVDLVGDSGSVSGDNTGANLEVGEAACLGYEPSSDTILGYGGGRSVWFKFTAPGAGGLTLETSASGGSPIGDSIIVAIDGSNFATANRLDADDDSGAGAYSLLVASLPAAGTYYIAVDGYNGDATDDIGYDINNTSEGTFTLTWAFARASIWESFEEATINTSRWTGWESGGVGFVDPNTLTEFEISSAWADAGVQSLVVNMDPIPSHLSRNRMIYHQDVVNGSDPDRDYYLGFKFRIEDFAPLWNGGDFFTLDMSMVDLRRSNTTPTQGFSGAYIDPTSDSAGEFGFTGSAPNEVVVEGATYEYRLRVTVHTTSPGAWTFSEWWNGTLVTNDEAGFGTLAAPTGIGIAHYQPNQTEGTRVFLDRIAYQVDTPLETGLPDPDFVPYVLPEGQELAVFVDDVEITNCVLSGSVTRKLNKPWQATWRMPIDCSVNGTCSRVKIYILTGLTTTLWFTGRITQMSDECDEDFCYTEYTALDASELWTWRPVRDSTCDFSDPQIISDNATGPQIIQAALVNSESCDAGDPGFGDSEGPLFLQYGTFEGGGVDLTGAPVDWPMTIAELVGVLTDTGEVDVVLTPIDDPVKLAQIDVKNGDYGTDLTATVAFEYATGNNNCKIIRQVSDSTNVVNKLWYYLGPRVDTVSDPQGVQHWAANVQGDDPKLPGNVNGGSGVGGAIPGRPSDVGGTLGVRRQDSQDACGVRMEVKIFDARGDEAIVAHELYRRLWQEESWLRAVPRTLVHVTPINTSQADLLPPGVTPVQVGDFDIGDLVTVSAGAILRGGFTGAQRIYEYTVSWDEDGVVEIGELLTSSDQEGI